MYPMLKLIINISCCVFKKKKNSCMLCFLKKIIFHVVSCLSFWLGSKDLKFQYVCVGKPITKTYLG